MINALHAAIASTSLGKIVTRPDVTFPRWTGPDPAVAHVQAILYLSLVASLLTASIAVLSKQWLNRYSQIKTRGSVDLSRHRQRKMNEEVAWCLDIAMKCSPLILQAAILLLNYALFDYLFFIDEVIAGTLIGFSVFSLLLYLFIGSAVTLFCSRPLQTPLPLIPHSTVRSGYEHRKHPGRYKTWFEQMFSHKKKQSSPKPGRSYTVASCKPYDKETSVISSRLPWPERLINNNLCSRKGPIGVVMC